MGQVRECQASEQIPFCFRVCVCGTGEWTLGLMHARPCPQSFCFVFCFWDRISITLPRLVLNLWSFCLCLLSSWDYRSRPGSDPTFITHWRPRISQHHAAPWLELQHTCQLNNFWSPASTLNVPKLVTCQNHDHFHELFPVSQLPQWAT
jgi:hypothetical protein